MRITFLFFKKILSFSNDAPTNVTFSAKTMQGENKAALLRVGHFD